jgi:hypothetical protein
VSLYSYVWICVNGLRICSVPTERGGELMAFMKSKGYMDVKLEPKSKTVGG